MHVHIGVMEFLVFVAYYIILKLIVHFIQVESRRNGRGVCAGVAGLLS